MYGRAYATSQGAFTYGTPTEFAILLGVKVDPSFAFRSWRINAVTGPWYLLGVLWLNPPTNISGPRADKGFVWAQLCSYGMLMLAVLNVTDMKSFLQVITCLLQIYSCHLTEKAGPQWCTGSFGYIFGVRSCSLTLSSTFTPTALVLLNHQGNIGPSILLTILRLPDNNENHCTAQLSKVVGTEKTCCVQVGCYFACLESSFTGESHKSLHNCSGTSPHLAVKEKMQSRNEAHSPGKSTVYWWSIS